MAVTYLSGAEMGHIGECYSILGDVQISSAVARSGGYSWRVAADPNNASYFRFRSRPPGGTHRSLFKSARFYFRPTTAWGATVPRIIRFFVGTLVRHSLTLASDGRIEVRDSFDDLLGITTNALSIDDAWHRIDFDCGWHTNGSGYRLFVDGVQWFSYAGGAVAELCDDLRMGTNVSGTSGLFYYDDIVAYDSPLPSELSDYRLGMLLPVTDSAVGSWRRPNGAEATLLSDEFKLPPEGNTSTVLITGARVENVVSSTTDNYDLVCDPYDRLVDRYLWLPGRAGSMALSPDSAAFDITGDLDLRACIAPDDWKPGGALAYRWIVGKWDAPNRSYALVIDQLGYVYLLLSTTGSNQYVAVSSEAVAFTGSSPGWIRATRVQATNLITFYTSSDPPSTAPDSVTWTELGASGVLGGIAAGANLFVGTHYVEVGSSDSGGFNNYGGKVYRVEIRNVIGGTAVASPYFPDMVNKGADPQGNLWYCYGVSKIFKGPGTGSIGSILAVQAICNDAQQVTTGSPKAGAVAVAENPQTGYVLFDAANEKVATPDAASISIAGDIDIRIDMAADNWFGGAAFTAIGKWATHSEWALNIEAGGIPRLYWTPDNGVVWFLTSDTALPSSLFGAGARYCVRATLDVDNGAGGCTVTFYYGPTLSGPWTQLGNPIVYGSITAIFDGTSELGIGNNGRGAGQVFGKVYGAQVRNGIGGTIVSDVRFGGTAPVDSAGLTWTLTGATMPGAPEFTFDYGIPNGTAGSLSAAAMGTFPTGWGTHIGPVATPPAVTTTVGPTVRVGKRVASTREVDVDFLGVYAMWQPYVAPPVAGGKAKVRQAGAFASKPTKIRIGGAWTEKPVKLKQSGSWVNA